MGTEKRKLAYQGQPFPQRRSAMSKWAKPQHKASARALGYALTLATHEGWWKFALILRARLTVQERAALAFIALQALDYDDACVTADAVLGFEQSEVTA